MANDIVDAARRALEPYVGAMVADTCLRATALSVGKTADDLSAEDGPLIEQSIRRLLAAVAPASTIEAIIVDMKTLGHL